MLGQLVLQAIGALALAIALLFAQATFKTLAARRELLKRGRGLRVADEFSIWAGHIYSLVFAARNLDKFDALLRRHSFKTIGFLYGAKQAVGTVDLELIRQMMSEGRECNRMQLDLPTKEVEVDSIVTAGDEQWRRIRRCVAPALKGSKFKTANVQREIRNSIDKLTAAIEAKLEAATGDEIELDVEDYAHRFSLDLVLNCFFKQDNLIDFHARVDPLTELMETGQNEVLWNPLVRLAVVFPVLGPLLDWLLNFHPQGIWRTRLMSFIQRQTELNFEARRQLEQLKRSGRSAEAEDCFTLQDGTQYRRNMIDYVIDQFHEGKLTRREFFHTSWFLLGAADRTAADTITHIIYQLATNPDVQEKVRESTRAEGEESEYLSWVINEALRLLPSVPSGCSRMATRDYKCQDGIVSAGTYVVTHIHGIHRMREYWGPDAAEFRPERFADAANFHPMQYMPFGYGPRGCPGKDFALHEMKKLLCVLLSRYRFSCEPLELSYSAPVLMFLVSSQRVRVKLSRL